MSRIFVAAMAMAAVAALAACGSTEGNATLGGGTVTEEATLSLLTEVDLDEAGLSMDL